MVSCQVSKEFHKGFVFYWFGLKRTTKAQLELANRAFCVFGLGSAAHVVMIPFAVLHEHLDSFFTSPDKEGDILHWHVRFERRGKQVFLMTERDRERLDISSYLLTKL